MKNWLHVFSTVLAAVIIGLLLGTPVKAQEAPQRKLYEFKGNELGMSLADFIRKHDRPTQGDPRHAPALFFSDDNTTGTILVQTHMGYEKHQDTVAGVPATVNYFFQAEHDEDWQRLANEHRRLIDWTRSWALEKQEERVGRATRPPLWRARPEFIFQGSISLFGSKTLRQ
jgi:hypothetical protein